MKRLILASLSSLAVLSLAACGGSSSSGSGESNLTKEESERAFDETASRTNESAQSAQNSAAFTHSLAQLAQDVDVDFEAQCNGGGSAVLTGSMSVPDDQTQSTDTEMNLTVNYQSCAEDNVTIDGDLSYVYASSTDDSGTTTMSMEMNGQLDFSGDVEGTCALDAAINVTMSVDLEGGSFDIQIDATGNVCGHALEDLNTEMTDPGTYEGGGGF